VKTDNC